MRVERPFAAPYDIEITRVRAMGDDKAKANGNADWKPTPKQLAQRDEFAGRFAKLCEAKRRKAIEDAAVEVEAKVEQEIKADAKATDETKQAGAKAEEPKSEHAKPSSLAGKLKYQLSFVSDWGLPPATVWLIDKFIPMGALIAAYALPKKLKTYVALSWACCIAVGLPWPRRQDGIPVKKGKVMYIALESYAGGVKRRVAAWCKAHGVSKKDFLRNFAFLPVPINFSDDGSIRDALAQLIFSQHFRPDFIVIDTWFKSVGGANVSDQAEMASAIERLGWFKEAFEAATEFKDALPASPS